MTSDDEAPKRQAAGGGSAPHEIKSCEVRYGVYIRASTRWCRVVRTFRDRIQAQHLAEDLSGEGNAVKVVAYESDQSKGVTVWESHEG